MPWPQCAQQAGPRDRDPPQVPQAAGSPGPGFCHCRGQGRGEEALALLFTKKKISNRSENAFHRCELCSNQLTRGGFSELGEGWSGGERGAPTSMHCGAECWVPWDGWSLIPGSFPGLTILRRQTEAWEIFLLYFDSTFLMQCIQKNSYISLRVHQILKSKMGTNFKFSSFIESLTDRRLVTPKQDSLR